ncbi:ARF guanine-nucleotide exchange factor GNOM [Sesamum angolense]|uniref:ARF guanine-nucleotide exchange factor GNOM n=1 Tax=Sesamum angolense TaxID=2727404 RepID=A0AAE2BZ43_9LAMI|nr:ARF guanine-nucleotide exchange factor GNOM [Sesamum angolense]
MGRLRLQSSIKAIEEEPEDCEATSSNKAALECMINSEIGAVLAVMRRNVRWGGRYVSGDDQLEHSLIQSLKTLRRQIFSWQNEWQSVNPSLYLQPFLDVIRSDETGAPITSVALSSIYKILTLDVLDVNTVNVEDAMHMVVDAVTSCRFEVTDPASEEVVLTKILQVLLACMKSKASVMLSNQHVCTIVNTCFRVVHQAGSKGELLQRIARHTMHELVRCIFSHLPDVDNTERSLVKGGNSMKNETAGLDADYSFSSKPENGGGTSEYDGQLSAGAFNASSGLISGMMDESNARTDNGKDSVPYDFHLMTEPYGLINSAIELGGPAIRHHPRLLNLVQDELFRNLMQFGLSMSPLILSMVCSIVLNLYQHLRTELKLQLEAFFSCDIETCTKSIWGFIPAAGGCNGGSS